MASYGRGSFDEFISYQSATSVRETGGNEFGKLSEKIGNNIQKITQNVAQLQKSVLLIGTPQDSEDIRKKIEGTIHYTKELHKETNNHLTSLAHLQPPVSASEMRQRKILKERLTDDFSKLLTDFQSIQREAVNKMRASVQRARTHSGINQSLFDNVIQSHDDTVLSQGVQFIQPRYSQTREVLQMEQDVDLDLLQERESAIKKLETDISDVNTIFKDLSVLVHEQGETLDSIEANIDNAQMSAHDGTQQLSRARQYQQKSRRRTCILFMIFMIAIIILALVIWGATR